MASEPIVTNPILSNMVSQDEPKLTIQFFNQCISLVSIKLNTSNFLLWCSQVLPLSRSLGIAHHLIDANKLAKENFDENGEKLLNPQHSAWTYSLLGCLE